MRVRAVAAASEVTVSWNHDESGPPIRFNVESQVSGGGYTPLTTVDYVAGQTAYSVVDSGGVPGVQYRVNAENSAGASAWSESNVPVFAPNAPTNVSASA